MRKLSMIIVLLLLLPTVILAGGRTLYRDDDEFSGYTIDNSSTGTSAISGLRMINDENNTVEIGLRSSNNSTPVDFGVEFIVDGANGQINIHADEIGLDGDVSVTGNLSATGGVSGSNINDTDWDTAYEWGDHSGMGYLTNMSSGIGGTQIADGTVSDEEYQRLDGLTDDIQTQLDGQDACNEITSCVPDAWDEDGDIPADEISEGKINFSTACASGNHYYLSGNDLACEADDDVPESGDYSNLTAGRSLTHSPTGTIVADSELYVFKAKIAFEDPVASDDFFFGEIAVNATATSIYCKTLVGTVDLDIQIAGVDINGSDITCDTSGVLDSSLGGDTDLNVGEELKLAITSVASSPTYLMVIINGVYDD